MLFAEQKPKTNTQNPSTGIVYRSDSSSRSSGGISSRSFAVTALEAASVVVAVAVRTAASTSALTAVTVTV